MANKTIPLKDKEVVIRRLAEGLSTRQAIEGTSIASNQTAARLAKEQSHKIAQYREDYLGAIEKWAGSRDHRARILGRMLYAEKVFRLGSVTERCHHIPINGNENTYIYVEDWDTRLKAIRYIDQLAGYMPVQGGMHISMLQQVNDNG